MQNAFSVNATGDGQDRRGPAAGEGSTFFGTSDFYLACYLRCIGYTLDDVRRDGRRMIFVFQDKQGRKADLMAFFGDNAEVSPLRFVSAIKDLKMLIHNS
jgi:hypothetical protein